MDIRHLRLFMTVCKYRNISSAASELGLNQPAMSKAIRRLETELDVSLFERTSRGVDLTPFGEVLRGVAVEIEANYRGALRQIDSLKAADVGEVVVGAGGTWRDVILPQAIANLCGERPHARVRVNIGTTDKLVSDLIRGEIDFMLAPVEIDETLAIHLRTEFLIKNRIIVVGRSGHPAATGRNYAIEELSELKWALTHDSIVRDRFQRLFKLHGIVPPMPVVEMQDPGCLFDIVEQTDLVTYVPDIRLSATRGGAFTEIRCDDAQDYRSSGLIMRRRANLSPLSQELIGHVKKLIPKYL